MDNRGLLALLVARARTLCASVSAPEMAALTLADLGILRDVQAIAFGAPSASAAQGYVIEITIAPPCMEGPAMDYIRDEILREMDEEGIPARIKTQLVPAWTSDWITCAGRDKLHQHGIALTSIPHRFSNPLSQPKIQG